MVRRSPVACSYACSNSRSCSSMSVGRLVRLAVPARDALTSLRRMSVNAAVARINCAGSLIAAAWFPTLAQPLIPRSEWIACTVLDVFVLRRSGPSASIEIAGATGGWLYELDGAVTRLQDAAMALLGATAAEEAAGWGDQRLAA